MYLSHRSSISYVLKILGYLKCLSMCWNRNHPRQLKNSEISIDAAIRTDSGNSDAYI
jgi:hypothetical protein